jgi:Cys-tRNA synthase (O-phospho-L-seryl-tRNA:Cys-tRNA synthase)
MRNDLIDLAAKGEADNSSRPKTETLIAFEEPEFQQIAKRLEN